MRQCVGTSSEAYSGVCVAPDQSGDHQCHLGRVVAGLAAAFRPVEEPGASAQGFTASQVDLRRDAQYARSQLS